ncbi:hypothetical protein [Rhodopirellula sp. MGV]|uniref:hypothetical protein n=1 Tax=Rhodopirellula sp. MGV TaxID=2023130 RepID=UPI000B968437|nr:hypothetical protein [Rhodopirellula sp. MGV]OYP34374.1 hypothetical protein CGZ80_15040 [Rhodopirellula sp. MGV]PNY37450.1 hypothetical protein C2E31_07985 [Rhodopirellula baltica]
MVRSLVILGALAFCAFLAGWFTIDRNEKETTIRFDRDEIRSDTAKAIEKGKEFLENHRQMNAEGGLENPAGEYPQESFPNNAYPGTSFPTESPYPQIGDQQATRPIPPWELPPGGTTTQY